MQTPQIKKFFAQFADQQRKLSVASLYMASKAKIHRFNYFETLISLIQWV